MLDDLIEKIFNLPLKKYHNLSRTINALKVLGNPHLYVPKTIHVAGTNGKGSTVTFLRSILEAHNNKVHAFMSPHLLKFNERIILNGKPISNDYLEYLILYVLKKFNNSLSFSEIIMCIGFLAFKEIKADFLILETGVGGRLDPTNVIPNPIATAITSISIDHTSILGSTLEEISKEKGAIQKKNALSFIAPQEHVKITEILKSLSYNLQSYIVKKNILYYKNHKIKIQPLLLGDHQIDNAALASSVCLGIGMNKKSLIIQGIKNAFIPARIQILKTGPLSGSILDGAHNIGGAKVLANFLKKNDLKKNNLLIAMMHDKDIKSFLKILSPFFIQAYTISLPYKRSCKADEFPQGILPIIPTTLKKIYDNPPKNLIICGSLYLASFILKDHT